jgi:taurine dioxygenase
MMIAITRLGGALGAEVAGVDLAGPLTDDVFTDVERAFADHLVLVFRDQELSAEQQVAFTSRFGAVEPHPLRSRRGVEGFPEVLVIENRPGRPGARNDEWHSDITCSERPPALSVLQALIVPDGLGATMYCNMYRAYETLSPGMRRMLEGMHALHSAESLVRRNNEPGTDALPIAEAPPPVSHPVVRTHSVTGRPALFVNPSFTIGFDGMTREESAPLLEFLYDHATRPENVYRHAWRRGDVVMWDNRCTMHYAVHDYDESTPRLMHRTTAAGDRPFFELPQAAA